MTKEELIKKLIDIAKGGVEYPMDAYCHTNPCLTCPFQEANCVQAIIGELINRLIKAEEFQKAEEHQETNYDHYIKTYSLIRYDNEVTFKLKDGWEESFCDFWSGDFREWLISPYKEPPKPKYKLTQFEYDLLRVHAEEMHPGCIHHYWELKGMQDKGYLKDMPADVPIKDFIDDCEVVDDD